MTALVLIGLAGGLGTVTVGCWRAVDRDAEEALADRPGSDDQWSELVPIMRSVRRHRRRERRAVRRAT